MISIKEKGQGVRIRGRHETVFLTAKAVGHGVFVSDIEVHQKDGTIVKHDGVDSKRLDLVFSSFKMTSMQSSGVGWLISVVGISVVDGPRKIGLETIREVLKKIDVEENAGSIKRLAAGFTFGSSAGGIVCVEELPMEFGKEMCHGYKLGLNFTRHGPKFMLEMSK